MPTLHVDLGSRGYDVIVEPGLLELAGEPIAKVLGAAKHLAVVTDSTVAPLHADSVLTALHAVGFTTSLHVIPAGEASKSMQQVETVCREMITAGHDRKSALVALGGGVVGDLAGFVAAIFYRGIPFVQLPTTIVAQVDSSVGGKTGVNVAEGKNLLGAFHQPELVLVDPRSLVTLPDREFCEGFAEAIKHAAIRDASMIDELAAFDPNSRAVPAELIARNIGVKARIVEDDEHETLGIRALLNFGHTIGHGIEASVPYGELLHGEAISLGMRAALFLSTRHAGLPAEEAATIEALLRHYRLPMQLPDTISTARVMEKLSRDKKFDTGAIRFVLLHRIGDARVSSSLSAADLEMAIDFLRS